MADVLAERVGALGLVTLNRPQALNALTHDMALALEERLLAWRGDASVAVVAITGAGEKAFCAGGDVRALWDAARADPAAEGWRNFQFYEDEYRLNALIKRYPKPYVALMDGVVMGGGVGVSLHGRWRVAGDATLFAMPEVSIGLFPDVGATYALPRLPGRTGLWLGLTGARLRAADCVAAGLCDGYVPSERHGALIEALAAVDGAADAAVAAAARRFFTETQGATLPERFVDIDRLFAADDLEGLLTALDADGGDWAAAQAAAVRAGSPTSAALTVRQLSLGATLDFEACMALEGRLARFCMTRPDFYEGVRAKIIDKTGDPAWRPATPAEVDHAALDAAFAG